MAEQVTSTYSTSSSPAKTRVRRTWRRPQIGLHIAIIFLLVLSALPIYLMLVVSFKNPLQYQHERWTVSFPLRITNYAAAWEMIGHYIWNTAFVAVTGFVGMAILSVIGAYVFARMRFPFREPLFVAVTALLLVPWVLSFVPAYVVYNDYGLVNTYWALIIPRIVGGSIFGIFFLRAYFAGLPEELFEAARMDGANLFDLIWRITLPLSMPILATLAVLEFVNAWNDFLWPFVAANTNELRVISVGLYFLSVDSVGAGLGPLFAGYVIASIPLAIVFFALGKLYVEGLVSSGIKV
jgi:ABC-type glycerol-3-phosphate transport system permease component